MNKLTWEDIGSATVPGQYQTRFGMVEVTGDDVAIWKQFPQAKFAVVGLSLRHSSEVLHLGAFDISDDLRPMTKGLK